MGCPINITTKITVDTSNNNNASGSIDTLSKLTTSVFDKEDRNTEEYIVDYALLDNNIMGALTGVSRETTGDNGVDTEEGNDTLQESSEVEVDIARGKLK